MNNKSPKSELKAFEDSITPDVKVKSLKGVRNMNKNLKGVRANINPLVADEFDKKESKNNIEHGILVECAFRALLKLDAVGVKLLIKEVQDNRTKVAESGLDW